MTTSKFCVNCAFAGDFGSSPDICTRTVRLGKPDPVYGARATVGFRRDERRATVFTDTCGPSGKYYKERGQP